MLWIRDIPSYRFLKPTSWKIANRQDRRITPFQVVGLDFAGLIGYKPETKKKRKSYIFLLACSLTRAVHLALLPNQTAKEFLKHHERLITRKRPPQEYYLYNEQCFVAAVKWSNGVVKHVLFIRFSQSRMCLWIQSSVKFDVSKSHTNSVKINSKQNLVCLTKKSFFDLSLTAPTLGARSFMGVQKLFSAYRGTYSRRGRRISLPELIIAPLTCENS